ncbi:MAG: helix-turn-helix domain-containing protein [Candidatus Dormiibacterota bacterium]
MASTTFAPTNARSRRTLAALLASAQAILEERGFEALTMTAVADRARVTRRTVYLHFASRAELVGALFDHVAGVVGLQESVARVWDAPDAAGALDAWAAHLARYHPRLLAVDRAVERVRHVDPDAAAHRKRVVAEKLRNCRRLVARLQAEGRLAAPWTGESAGDMLFALISSDLIEALIVDRRWSRERLARHLAVMFRSTFLADQPQSTTRSPSTSISTLPG